MYYPIIYLISGAYAHANECPKLFRIWLGPILMYGIADPEYFEKFLTKSLDKGIMYKPVVKIIGKWLFSNPGVPNYEKSKMKSKRPRSNLFSLYNVSLSVV